MSNRYKGGVISATPPTTTGGESGTASGAWTLEQQMQLQAAGLWPAQPTGPWIEDCFSTYLYTGNGSTQTITNGINLSGKGGLVWYKDRTTAYEHQLVDTVRGAGYNLESPNTSAQASRPTALTAFNTTGFTLGSNAAANGSGDNFVSWTFRKQEKFFDVVTWTGDSTAGRTVAHNLGSVPACIIVKCTSQAVGGGWPVYHRSLGNTQTAALNTTDAAFTYGYWNNTTPTSTVFTLNGDSDVNGTGKTYVAYLFAHDAGGFGLTGTDNVISCGSYTGNGSASGPTISLGYEPQWVMIKNATDATNWAMFDNMRGIATGGTEQRLYANTSGAEVTTSGNDIDLTATGFDIKTDLGYLNTSGSTFIYIAIRRGPMKVPTSGTSVFEPTAFTSQSGADTVSSGSVPVVDWGFVKLRTSSQIWIVGDRLRGGSYLSFDATSAEASNVFQWDKQNAFVTDVSDTPSSFIGYSLRRAPSFFDEVCYTGNSTARTVNHNLGVAPELIIVKARSGTFAGNIDWFVYASPLGNSSRLLLNTTDALADGQPTWNSTTPTSSVFSLGTSDNINGTGYTYVAYLFATCAGVSKVGSYTGTATTKQIDCGFTAGSRFVMIKRTDSTGDWYVWDSARGIIAGNDPYLLLNSTAAEVTNTDYVDTYNAGFEISSTAPAGINANGGTYIFLAIA